MAEPDKEGMLCAWISLEAERERGSALLRELAEGLRGWQELDGKERRLASGVALVDLLLERSRQARFEDPVEMVEWAKMACELGERLAFDPNGNPAIVGDWAVAWAELGNAYRVADDLDRAEEALDRARELVFSGGAQSRAQLRVTELFANLWADLRRFTEAAELLEALARVYCRRDEIRELGSVLVQLANVRTESHEPEAAVLAYRRALAVLAPDDPLTLSAVHGLALTFVDTKRPRAAQGLIESYRRLYKKAGRLNEIRLVWLEGKIAYALDQSGEAEAKLNVARLAFLRQDKPGDSALVSLDLALLLARQRRRTELASLVGQMHATFTRLGIAREAIASLLLLKTSCEQGASVDRLCGQIEALASLLPELAPKSGVTPKRRRSRRSGATSV